MTAHQPRPLLASYVVKPALTAPTLQPTLTQQHLGLLFLHSVTVPTDHSRLTVRVDVQVESFACHCAVSVEFDDFHAVIQVGGGGGGGRAAVGTR